MLSLIKQLYGKKIIAIEGEPGTGKSTLAKYLGKELDALVISIDDFYKPLNKRNEDTFKRGGNNIDFARLIDEVLSKHLNKQIIKYMKYNCQTDEYTEPEIESKKDVLIIEGSYTLREEIIDYFDFKILMVVSKFEQDIRIKNRPNYDDFVNKWIPLSRSFIKDSNIASKVDIVLKD